MSAAPCLALELDPVAEDGDDIDAFTLVGLVTPTDPVVGPETLSTAGGRGVLGAEDGVTSPGGLPPILLGVGRGEPLVDDLLGVAGDGLRSVGCGVGELRWPQRELRPA